ncbi:MAG: lysoplasmalogenase [Marmoricola sp.]
MIQRSRGLKLGFLAMAAVDTYLSGSSNPRAHTARRITKPLLMPLLTAGALTDPRAGRTPVSKSTAVAQVAGWGGDVLLLGHGTEAFAAGAGSFGLGHLAYISGFRRLRRRSRRLVDSPVARSAAALTLTVGPVVARGAAKEEPVLAPAVVGYMTLLASMWAHAGNMDPARPKRGRALTLAGATLFTASDTMLGIRKFVWKDAPDRLESAVMATYTLGQFLLSEGALALAESASE